VGGFGGVRCLSFFPGIVEVEDEGGGDRGAVAHLGEREGGREGGRESMSEVSFLLPGHCRSGKRRRRGWRSRRTSREGGREGGTVGLEE